MQVIKLTINGQFWDSQIYSGKLYLFNLDGDLMTISWESAVSGLAALQRNERLSLAAKIAFLEGQLPYCREVKAFLSHPSISNVLKDDFRKLAQLDLQIDINHLSSYHTSCQENPFPFPHADSEVYYRKIYIGSSEGFFCGECPTTGTKTSKIKTGKYWDGPVFDISASSNYTTIALASGNDGLREISVDPKTYLPYEDRAPFIVADRHCNACEWSYQSIYAMSQVKESFLAVFNKLPIFENQKKTRKYRREFKEIVSSRSLFNENGFSWGAQDKIYFFATEALMSSNIVLPQNKKYLSHKPQFP